MLYIIHSILSKNGQEMKIINRFASDYAVHEGLNLLQLNSALS